jgi:hypothetical protein
MGQVEAKHLGTEQRLKLSPRGQSTTSKPPKKERERKVEANDFDSTCGKIHTCRLASEKIRKKNTNLGCLAPRISFWPYFLQLWPSSAGTSLPAAELTLSFNFSVIFLQINHSTT